MELRIILQLLLKKWRMMLVIVSVTIISTLIFTKYQSTIYSSSVTYVVSPSPEILNGTSFLSGLSVLGGQPTVANTYASIATSAIIKHNAIEALGISLSQANDLTVDSRVQTGTSVIEITVEGTDPLLVQTFANKIGESTVEYVKKFDSVYDLIILDSATSPDKPIRPNLRLNLVLGLALGFSLAGGLVILSGMNEY
jgi:capsular polysaccharide biosynthesis protein